MTSDDHRSVYHTHAQPWPSPQSRLTGPTPHPAASAEHVALRLPTPTVETLLREALAIQADQIVSRLKQHSGGHPVAAPPSAEMTMWRLRAGRFKSMLVALASAVGVAIGAACTVGLTVLLGLSRNAAQPPVSTPPPVIAPFTDRLESTEERLDAVDERLQRVESGIERLLGMLSPESDAPPPIQMDKMRHR